MNVPDQPRQVFAFSGVLNRPPGEKSDPTFLDYAVSLAPGDGRKRVCFIPTATGDAPFAIEAVTGIFAGSLCWHVGGPTDSFGDSLAMFTDGLGFLPYSNGVHDSLGDQPRHRVYREAVANGELPAGYATEDGTALHYIGTDLHEAVAMVDGACAWWVEPSLGGGYHVKAIRPRRL